MWSELSCPANQHPKSTIKKKSPQTFAHLVNSSQNVSFMFDNHTILLFWLQKTVRLLSLRDLRFLFCSRDLDALYAQMIMGFFSLITHKVGKCDHMVDFARLFPDQTTDITSIFNRQFPRLSTLPPLHVLFSGPILLLCEPHTKDERIF